MNTKLLNRLATAHVRDLAPDGTTVTLHDHGLHRGCMTHPAPDWARPLLGAAALLWKVGSNTSGRLFSDPLGSCAGAGARGALPVRSWEASSAKVTSRMWCSASMDQWPRIRAASCAGVARSAGRLVTA